MLQMCAAEWPMANAIIVEVTALTNVPQHHHEHATYYDVVVVCRRKKYRPDEQYLLHNGNMPAL